MHGDDRHEFIRRYGGIYEHSPWVAERAWDLLVSERDLELAEAMARAVDEASDEKKLALIRAHPDLAARASVRAKLTAESVDEQASAGIDRCTPAEFERFNELNDRYRQTFGFPFVMAVRGSNRHAILAAFEERLANDAAAEFAKAIAEIHKIARLRLAALHGQAE